MEPKVVRLMVLPSLGPSLGPGAQLRPFLSLWSPRRLEDHILFFPSAPRFEGSLVLISAVSTWQWGPSISSACLVGPLSESGTIKGSGTPTESVAPSSEIWSLRLGTLCREFPIFRESGSSVGSPPLLLVLPVKLLQNSLMAEGPPSFLNG